MADRLQLHLPQGRLGFLLVLSSGSSRVRWVGVANLSSREPFSTPYTSIPSDTEGQGLTGDLGPCQGRSGSKGHPVT